MTELEMICKRSDTQVSQCDCLLCQSMCLRAPCLGTPSDIVTLINHGYVHELELTFWDAPNPVGIKPFASVQIRRTEHGGCPLFRNGKCTINEIKPTDGKLASCKKMTWNKDKPDYLSLIAESWDLPYNNNRIKFIFKALYRYACKTAN